MNIKGIDKLSMDDLRNEVSRGGKFVYFSYCISIIVATYRKTSDVYFVRPGEGAFKHGWPFFLISFFFGWWGIPWGPIYTFGALFSTFKGKNVTPDVMEELEAQYIREHPISGYGQFNQQINQ
jgi:hypothetical protein